MARVQRFEDLAAWQKARILTKTVLTLTAGDVFARRYRLAGQLESAAVSVMSNIAEGFERDGTVEFQRFLTIAKASCGEVRSLLYGLVDAELIDIETFERLKAQAEEISRMVAGLRRSLESGHKTSAQRTMGEDFATPYVLELE